MHCPAGGAMAGHAWSGLYVSNNIHINTRTEELTNVNYFICEVLMLWLFSVHVNVVV